jgi:hypothetical protein
MEIGKEGVKLCLFPNYMIAFTENSRKLIRK